MEPVTYENLTIRAYEHGSADDKKGYILRHDVLALVAGVSDKTLEFIYGSHDDEADQTKLGAFVDDGMVATLCLVPHGNGEAMIKQFAVSTKLQGQGVGRKLLEYAHAVAKEMGYTRIVLDARMNAAGFYAKCGYIFTGKRRAYTLVTLDEMYIDLV